MHNNIPASNHQLSPVEASSTPGRRAMSGAPPKRGVSGTHSHFAMHTGYFLKLPDNEETGGDRWCLLQVLAYQLGVELRT